MHQLDFIFRSLDEREFLMIRRFLFCKFCLKTYTVTPHSLDETGIVPGTSDI